MHLNIRSLKPHFEQLEALTLSLESPPDFVCLTEIWLKDNDNCAGYLIVRYNQYCIKNRQNAKGRRVMIQMRNTCNFLRVLKSVFEESLTADLALNVYHKIT